MPRSPEGGRRERRSKHYCFRKNNKLTKRTDSKIDHIRKELDRYLVGSPIHAYVLESNGIYLNVGPLQIKIITMKYRTIKTYLVPNIFKWLVFVFKHQQYERVYPNTQDMVYRFYTGTESFPESTLAKRRLQPWPEHSDKYYYDWCTFQDRQRGDFTCIKEQINTKIDFDKVMENILRRFISHWKEKTFRYGSKKFFKLCAKYESSGWKKTDPSAIDAYIRLDQKIRDGVHIGEKLQLIFDRLEIYRQRTSIINSENKKIRARYAREKLSFHIPKNDDRMVDINTQIVAVLQGEAKHATCITEYGFTEIYPYNFIDLLNRFMKLDIDTSTLERRDPWTPYSIHIFKHKNKFICFDNVLEIEINLPDIY